MKLNLHDMEVHVYFRDESGKSSTFLVAYFRLNLWPVIAFPSLISDSMEQKQMHLRVCGRYGLMAGKLAVQQVAKVAHSCEKVFLISRNLFLTALLESTCKVSGHFF